MGLSVGFIEILLIEGLALELLSKSSLLCKTSTVLFFPLSLLLPSEYPKSLSCYSHNREESKIQGLKLDSHTTCGHQ